jgi:hypothetical protein
VNFGIDVTPDLSNAEFRTDAVEDQPVENDPAMEKARKWLEKEQPGEQNAITIHALLEEVDAKGNTINAVDMGEGIAVRLLLMGRRQEKTPLTELAESVMRRRTK